MIKRMEGIAVIGTECVDLMSHFLQLFSDQIHSFAMELQALVLSDILFQR